MKVLLESTEIILRGEIRGRLPRARIVGVVSHGDFRLFEHSRLDEETGIWERI